MEDYSKNAIKIIRHKKNDKYATLKIYEDNSFSLEAGTSLDHVCTKGMIHPDVFKPDWQFVTKTELGRVKVANGSVVVAIREEHNNEIQIDVMPIFIVVTALIMTIYSSL